MYLSFANRSRALQELIDRQFDFMNLYDSRIDSGRYQLRSTDSDHIIQVSLPGHDRESVKVSVEEGKLLISANLPDEKETSLTKSEIFKFSLPKGCNLESIDAQMLNGILTVTVSKETEKPKSKRIEVSIG
jgi:HSP20 family molecular chaperone IbpA